MNVIVLHSEREKRKMNIRENFKKTMHHQENKHFLIDFGGNPLSTMEGKSEEALLEFMGYKPKKLRERLYFGQTKRLDERILKQFHIDTRSIGGIMIPNDSQLQILSDKEYIDEWGIRRIFTGLYWEAINAPLKSAGIEELKRYKFPNPDSIDMVLLQQYEEQARKLYEETDYVICAEHPVYGIFELGCWLCGFDDFLYKMIADSEFVNLFFEKVLTYQKRIIELYYGKLGHYIHYTSSGDDYATQNGPFMSPEMFRKFICPYFAERIAYTKKYTNAYYLHHSCGSVYMLMDDIIKCGVDIVNPIQPKATDMNSEKLKIEFGDRIVFHGGIDTQELLPFSDRSAIREEVTRVVETMNQNGGYIFAAAHNIQEDVKPEKLAFMLEIALKCRR